MINDVIAKLQSVDWQNVGALIFLILTNIGLIIAWLRKNVSNLNKLREDSSLTNNMINYAKASMKSNGALESKIESLNNELYKLGKIINYLNDKIDKLEREDPKDGI